MSDLPTRTPGSAWKEIQKEYPVRTPAPHGNKK